MLRFWAPDSVWDFSSAGFGIFDGTAAIRPRRMKWARLGP
jgi:hypothetical protein